MRKWPKHIRGSTKKPSGPTLPITPLWFPDPTEPGDYEQLVTERISEKRFRLMCIPFGLRNVALGDVIEVAHNDSSATDTRTWKVVESSGRWVFRVWLEGRTQAEIEKAIGDLQAMGALTERSSEHLYAIDAKDDKLATKVADFLWEGESKGLWVYETGRS
jgi:hypothetical protein